VVTYLPKLKEFAYAKLPKAVEEAMLIYATSKKADLRWLKGYSASPKTLEDFRDLSKLMSGKEDRAVKYENTYWYYLLFTSPHASTK